MPDPTPHQPTDKLRAQVSSLKSFGHTHEEIAAYFDIDDMTLVKYYKRELDTACINANSAIANKLFRKAHDQDNLDAQKFWLKTRARWREPKDDDNRDTLIEQLIKQLQNG